jgi:UDP-glucose 4-epimerase
MMKSEILLVGGSGFLGSALAEGLSRREWRVGIFDRLPPRAPMKNVETFIGESSDADLLRRALAQYPRVVYLAQATAVAPAADRLLSSFTGNLEVFLKVLDEATRAGVREFTLFSSGGAVYGEPEHLPVKEDDPKHPLSPYGVLKMTMEHYLAMVAAAEGFRHLCLRPSNPYGPGQNFDGAQGLVAVSMARLARGLPISILGEGSAIKDYVYIDDFVDAVIRLLNASEASSGPFNIGSAQGRSVREVIDLVAKTVGKEAIVERKPMQPGDVQRSVLDIGKIRSLTGWKPTTPFEQGLVETWRWMSPRL